MIQYKGGYKYQLIAGDSIMTAIYPGQNVDTQFISLTPLGKLTVKPGYAWDGPSGPTFDTKTFMRGSLFHDALYQIMREGYIGSHEDRKRADEILRDVCRADGMTKIRSWWVYRAVRIGAKNSSEVGRPILEAP